MIQLPKAARIVGLVLHIAIGGLMIFAGSGKAFGFAPKEIIDQMTKIGMADKITLIGTGELISAVLLIVPVTASLGVLLTSAFWGGVICIHMAHAESYVMGSVMLVFTWLGAFLRYPAMFNSFFAGSHSKAITTIAPQHPIGT